MGDKRKEVGKRFVRELVKAAQEALAKLGPIGKDETLKMTVSVRIVKKGGADV